MNCPCAGVCLLFSLAPPSSLSGPMPVQPNFRGQGLSCICGIASSSDGQMGCCHSFALLATTSLPFPPPPDAPARLSDGQGYTSVHTKPIRLVNVNTVQHRVYGGFAWRQISASKSQSPWNNAHPCPLHRQIRGRSSNAIWQRQCQPPTGELLAQPSGVFSESRPPSLDRQPFFVSCQALLALVTTRNRRIADNLCCASLGLSEHRALYLEFQLASGQSRMSGRTCPTARYLLHSDGRCSVYFKTQPEVSNQLVSLPILDLALTVLYTISLNTRSSLGPNNGIFPQPSRVTGHNRVSKLCAAWCTVPTLLDTSEKDVTCQF